MWRLLYLGDGVNHLPEPSWKESGALALNNVYAFGGARLANGDRRSGGNAAKRRADRHHQNGNDGGQTRRDLLPDRENDLVLWRATLANLKGQSSLDVIIGTYQGKYVLNGDAGVTTVLEKPASGAVPVR